MKKSTAKEVIKVCEFIQSNRESSLWHVELIEAYNKDYRVKVASRNTAYRHELNALVMVLDGCGVCCTMVDNDPDENLCWELF